MNAAAYLARLAARLDADRREPARLLALARALRLARIGR